MEVVKPARFHPVKPVAVAVAVTKTCPRLQALTSAALLLPGLADSVSAQPPPSNNQVNLQYSHYQEGKRNLYNQPNTRAPIEVDTFHLNSTVDLTDRIQFSFALTQDTWSGATPVATAPLAARPNNPIISGNSGNLTTTGASPLLNTHVLVDKQLNPIEQDPLTGALLGKNTQTVHILSSASPETRQQGDFSLAYEWDEAAIALAGGLSHENDYQSSYGRLNTRFDFNQKLTTLNVGLSYTHSNTQAILDHDAATYITKTAYADQIEFRGGSEILHGNKNDWSGSIGLSQVLTKNALFDVNLGLTHSQGFMENPYKATTVIFLGQDPQQQTADILVGDVHALLEQRPDTRNQFSVGSQYIHYIEPWDASVHLSYQFSHDNWQINAHSFEAEWIQPIGSGWTVSPRIRYYSQSSANFYTPYLFSNQSFRKIARDSQGREIWVDADAPDNGVEYFRDQYFNLVDSAGQLVDENQVNAVTKTVQFDAKQLPQYFSSDHRLSGYGALSGGLTVSKTFAQGISLEAGVEYYTHAGSLKLGGNGEGAYTNFDFFSANATLSVALDALNNQRLFSSSPHPNHQHHTHSGHFAPAGLMFSHLIGKTNHWMIGYRYMQTRQAGDILHGSSVIDDVSVVHAGCGETIQCRFMPTYMDMGMHMLNIMYAPTDWLNITLMPQWVDMSMNLRNLDGRPPLDETVHEHTGVAGHATGGVGDTLIASLVRLWHRPGHQLHLGLGLSAPTGNVDLEFRRIARIDGGLVHFGMQLGSGTWDLLPSLTYNGQQQDWFWGGQLSANLRLQSKNKSGYRLGNYWQGTVWGGYQFTDWLAASVRSIYSVKGAIKGDFNRYNGRSGPMDFPVNYGGKFWDLGLGVKITLPKGQLVGNSLSFEWLQPLHNDMNGYQIKRQQTLFARWNYAF